nr:DUF2306 domain-containing protein [Streptomonospora sp. PA3]
MAATPYCLLGALQFSAGLRRRRPAWHRRSGRVLAPLGIVAALTGVWMTLSYDLPDVDGGPLGALGLLRLGFGTAMAACIVLGFAAIRRGRVAAHRAWMMRGYAIGVAAGTQVLTSVPWLVAVGEMGETSRALTMGAGWVVNLAVAEWVIRARPVRAGRGPAPAVPAARA